MGTADARDRYWPVLLVRAAVAAVAALVVTFSADHSPALGLILFGAFALLTGAVLAGLARRAGLPARGTLLLTLQGAAGIVCGIAALLLLVAGAGLAALVTVVALWAAVSGGLELAIGLRRDEGSALSRDHVVLGAFTLVLALAVLLGREDAVFVVGSVGAYAAITAVYAAIAAFTLKWDARPESRSAVRS